LRIDWPAKPALPLAESGSTSPTLTCPVPIALRAVCSDGGGGELEVKRSLFETPAPEQADSKAARHPAIHPAMPALSAPRRPRRGCAGGLACGKRNIDRSPRRLRVGAIVGR
jgi:hypothetical protein